MGQDGIICTDAGALGNMVNRHKYYADLPHGAAGASRRASTSFSTASSADALNRGAGDRSYCTERRDRRGAARMSSA